MPPVHTQRDVSSLIDRSRYVHRGIEILVLLGSEGLRAHPRDVESEAEHRPRCDLVVDGPTDDTIHREVEPEVLLRVQLSEDARTRR